MKKLIILPLLALVLCSCTPEKKEDKGADEIAASMQQRHLGTWQATGIGMDEITWTFATEKIEMRTPKKTYPGTYTIDYTKTPLWLDIEWEDRPAKCLMEFIDDDTFRIIAADDPAKPRPTAFEPQRSVVVFKKLHEEK